MLQLQCLIFVAIIGFSQSSGCCGSSCPIGGYYWREFYGTIPFDAFPGGTTNNGRPIYIGQTLYLNTVLCGKIYENDNKIYAPLHTEITTTKFIKILCSQTPERLTWINTTTTGVNSLNRHLVIGGREPDYTLYVGRAQHSNEITPGKVAVQEKGQTANDGLWISQAGVEYRHSTFQVLSYA